MYGLVKLAPKMGAFIHWEDMYVSENKILNKKLGTTNQRKTSERDEEWERERENYHMYKYIQAVRLAVWLFNDIMVDFDLIIALFRNSSRFFRFKRRVLKFLMYVSSSHLSFIGEIRNFSVFSNSFILRFPTQNLQTLCSTNDNQPWHFFWATLTTTTTTNETSHEWNEEGFWFF
jgi:hypothetical protein